MIYKISEQADSLIFFTSTALRIFLIIATTWDWKTNLNDSENNNNNNITNNNNSNNNIGVFLLLPESQ